MGNWFRGPVMSILMIIVLVLQLISIDIIVVIDHSTYEYAMLSFMAIISSTLMGIFVGIAIGDD